MFHQLLLGLWMVLQSVLLLLLRQLPGQLLLLEL
jgi:hypothetical protein